MFLKNHDVFRISLSVCIFLFVCSVLVPVLVNRDHLEGRVEVRVRVRLWTQSS